MTAGTVETAEIARFDALAARWWDPNGPMRALHRMNPARIEWACRQIAEAFASPGKVRLLDVGCGAGIAAEALARRGFEVTGIDAAPDVIAAAAAHATGAGLTLRYRVAAPEDLLASGDRFQVITALEVIEHVPEPAVFLRCLARLLEPGGLLLLSTLNRTSRSFVAAKIAAEYVLGWLPVGTHDWRRFLTPAELAASLRKAGLRPVAASGLNMDALGRWRAAGTMAVNYLVAARR